MNKPHGHIQNHPRSGEVYLQNIDAQLRPTSLLYIKTSQKIVYTILRSEIIESSQRN